MNTIRITPGMTCAPEPLGENFFGESACGSTVSLTSESVMLDGKPVFWVCGEIHYSRVNPDQWEDAILKMKQGGLDIAATYVFWNVHEEEEGLFRFDGCRNLRGFLEVCAKHGMKVILRIGPFDHGEMRNGGLPDWLFGKPFDVRGNNEGYLSCVRRLYAALHAQIDGLYFRQNGPVVAIQLENEYMHSSAPWEITTGVSEEWVSGGHDGEAHISALRRIAREEGLIVPFYTATAWGGGMAPADEVLPLWGGYAYQPWIFYSHTGEHPLTPEYIYRDNHNNAVPKTYNFEPRYRPESRPYACCEMMGGMMCCYDYRFTLPPESVDAMANIKLGSGCAMLGYYMYRGGTTPTGKCTPFLNESQICKRSYDYQAPIGEFGQVRAHWARLRTLHDFCHSFADGLIGAKTYLPEGTADMQPDDTAALRWCVREKDGSGFVFVNDFQDHAQLPPRRGEVITLHLPGETLTFGPFDLASGENAVLPFRFDIDGHLLRTADAQPITRLMIGGSACWFFMAPDGMAPRFRFAEAEFTPDADSVFEPWPGIRIYVLSRRTAMCFSHIRVNGSDVAILTDGVPLWDGEHLRLEHHGEPVRLLTLPDVAVPPKDGTSQPMAWNGFSGFTYTPPRSEPIPIHPETVGENRYAITVPQQLLRGHKTVLLRVEYLADIGYAFIGGKLIGDNFCNGQPWDIRLDEHAEALAREPLVLYLSPIREGACVNVDSAMAGRMEEVENTVSRLMGITTVLTDEVSVSLMK